MFLKSQKILHEHHLLPYKYHLLKYHYLKIHLTFSLFLKDQNYFQNQNEQLTAITFNVVSSITVFRQVNYDLKFAKAFAACAIRNQTNKVNSVYLVLGIKTSFINPFIDF